jgi:hypothetical protein
MAMLDRWAHDVDGQPLDAAGVLVLLDEVLSFCDVICCHP